MWKIVFIGAATLSLAMMVGFYALIWYQHNPAISAALGGIDLAILLAGTKSVFDFFKTTTDLKKARLEMRKLELDIKEKEQFASKAESPILIATFEQVKEFAMPLRSEARSRSPLSRSPLTSFPAIFIILSSVVGFGVSQWALKYHESTQEHGSPQEDGPKSMPSSHLGPPTASPRLLLHGRWLASYGHLVDERDTRPANFQLAFSGDGTFVMRYEPAYDASSFFVSGTWTLEDDDLFLTPQSITGVPAGLDEATLKSALTVHLHRKDEAKFEGTSESGLVALTRIDPP